MKLANTYVIINAFSTKLLLPSWINSNNDIDWKKTNTDPIRLELISQKEVKSIDLQIKLLVEFNRWTTDSETLFRKFTKKMENNHFYPRIHRERVFAKTDLTKKLNQIENNIHGKCAFLPHPIYSLIQDITDNINIVVFMVVCPFNETHTTATIHVYRDFWRSNLFIQAAGDKLVHLFLSTWW